MPSFQLSKGAKPTHVYTSDRVAIPVEPGGTIETEDERLLVRLRSDPLFAELKPKAVDTTYGGHSIEQFKKEPDIEHFVTEPPKKLGRPKKVKDDDSDAA